MRDSQLAFVFAAFTPVGVTMMLLHNSEQHHMDVAMYLLILFAFPLLCVILHWVSLCHCGNEVFHFAQREEQTYLFNFHVKVEYS